MLRQPERRPVVLSGVTASDAFLWSCRAFVGALASVHSIDWPTCTPRYQAELSFRGPIVRSARQQQQSSPRTTLAFRAVNYTPTSELGPATSTTVVY
ncbi:hypothetical protein PR003_g14608 [Phytophthora rubi]|uniref:Uncharacterized protein n=1 Tax=Phytophthora rubi TaxID=129364 RepID=A0A6A4F291_9STRA|nr:hypothetical protein PR001_g4479 [Phytophthora rubi]KAE9332227.1 hypothetical protein PR003_g14608 [Phytophthora rubi]